ncbi:MAG: DUF3253 domain-containing protein [Pseudomonadota bacterium]
MSDTDGPKGSPVTLAILDLITLRGPGKTICPTEAAKAVSPYNWRKVLPDVRASAIKLAVAEKASIYRKGKPVDPLDFKGVYRIGLPMEEDNDTTGQPVS